MFAWSESIVESRHRVLGFVVITGACWAALSAPSYAIPSPDLVVNSLSVVAQGAGVLIALFGGLTVARRRSSVRGSAPGRLLPALCGLFALLLVGALWLMWQTDNRNHERLTRALVRSSTQNGEVVHDVDLKELKFSEQIKHPLGLTTDQVAALIDAGRPPLILDVREDEEYAMGFIRGAEHIRYPDLKAREEMLVGHDQVPLLLCFSGNRSGELTDYFQKRGIVTHFMVGGYEKWFVEGRELINRRVRNSIRDIADYQNKDVLLETNDLIDEYRKGDVVFLDTRYPAEFEWDHLPQSIPLTVRKLRSAEMEQQLAQLPSGKRFVGVCYDKRSSFYSLILGAKVTALGHQWLGRYTVPYEFPTDPKTLARADAPEPGVVALVLAKLGRAIGSPGLAIILLVLIVRLALFPLAWFGELQASRTARAKPALAELKAVQRSGGTPRHGATEICRRHGVRPLWSLLASFAQLGVFLWLFAALVHAPVLNEQPFLSPWIRDLSRPDRFHVLPALVALLVIPQLLLLRWRSLWWRSVAGALSAMLFLALTFGLPAATTLFLAVSLGLQLVQTLVLRARLDRSPRRLRERPARPPARQHVRFFDEIAAADAAVGNKAKRLALLQRAGFRVSAGFVLVEETLDTIGKGDVLTGAVRREIFAAARTIGGPFAVRSSAVGEDGAGLSYAGIFSTKLGVALEGLERSIVDVTRSFGTRRAATYAGDQRARPCILVQRMVRSQHSGVLFTRHPTNSSAMLIEVTRGLGEALVSGAVRPDCFAVGRTSLATLGGETSELPLADLAREALRIESYFGKPQDIEWAWDGKQFVILQSRDITAEPQRNHDLLLLEAEKERLLATCSGVQSRSPVFEQNGLSELLPVPTLSSLSLMRRLYRPDGAAANACTMLGIPFDTAGDADRYLETICGRLYLNRVEERILFGGRSLISGWRAAWRIQRAARTLTHEFEHDFLPGFLHRMRVAHGIALASLPTDDLHELLGQWVDAFATKDYVWAEMVNIVAEFFSRSPQSHRQSSEPTPTYRMHELVRSIKQGAATMQDYIDQFGHRSPHDYELSEPRFAEDPAPISRLVAALPADTANHRGHGAHGEFEVLKDRAKDLLAREIALIRKVLVELGRRYGIGDQVFHLDLDEIERLRRGEIATLAETARQRSEARARLVAVPLAPSLAVDDLEALGSEPVDAGDHDHLCGQWVSGAGGVEGPVRVLSDPTELGHVQRGEILIAPHMSPEITIIYGTVRGVITEMGGMLSHAAIVAREYQLPAIVGVRDACRHMKTGDWIRMGADGRIEVLTHATETSGSVALSA